MNKTITEIALAMFTRHLWKSLVTFILKTPAIRHNHMHWRIPKKDKKDNLQLDQ